MIIRYLTQDDITEHDKVSSQAFSIECDIYDKNSVFFGFAFKIFFPLFRHGKNNF